jgi:parallel beta-helix repeat protein
MRRARVLPLLIFASLLAVRGVEALDCGEVIKHSVTLTADLDCSGNGIVIDGDRVVLDLGGRTIRGPGRGGWVWPGRALTSVGIRVAGKKSVVIRSGRLTNFATGVLIEESEETVVERVQALSNHYGIYLFRGGKSALRGVDLSSNIYGLHLQDTRENLVTRSLIFKSHHGSPGGYGINLYGSDRNTISENRIEANQSQGVWLIDSRNNLIYRNNLIRNSTSAVDETGANRWYHAERREGNFWSDHRGTGPYPVGGFAGARDLYPATKEIPLGKIP